MPVRFSVFIATTLDGFIAREDGSFDFLAPFHGEDHGYDAFFDTVDALVIGSGTYETVRAFEGWPYGERRLIVCTSRAFTPRRNEEFFRGPPRELAAKLEKEGLRRVYLDGGALIRSFLHDGLVDDLCINIVPILLGSGRALFGKGVPELKLELRESKAYASGLVQLRYLKA